MATRGFSVYSDFSRVPAISVGGGFADPAGSLSGGSIIGGVLGGLAGDIASWGAEQLKGYLAAKAKAYLPGEVISVDGQPVEKKHRRMNVLNPHALRRSMRRVQGFSRFARKTIRFTTKVKMRKRKR